MLVRCSICQRQFESAESSVMPFCCERCRLVDLGRWLGEKYGMAVEPPEGAAPPDEEAQEYD